jgi:hypothetical protein
MEFGEEADIGGCRIFRPPNSARHVRPREGLHRGIQRPLSRKRKYVNVGWRIQATKIHHIDESNGRVGGLCQHSPARLRWMADESVKCWHAAHFTFLAHELRGILNEVTSHIEEGLE